MSEAHEYLQIPQAEFEVPDTIVLAQCGGRSEPFVKDVQPTKPGTCRAPKTGAGDSDEPADIPEVPRFEPRNVPSPSPSPTSTPEPDLTPGSAPTPTSTPIPSLEPTPTPTLEPTPSPVETPEE